MEKFRGTMDQRLRLRKALELLKDDGRTFGNIDKALHDKGVPVAKRLGRGQFDKIRRGETKRPDGEAVCILWEHIFSQYPDTVDHLEHSSLETDEKLIGGMFNKLTKFYDVSRSTLKEATQTMVGTYKCHQYSMGFNNFSENVPCAVAISEMQISLNNENGCLLVRENQSYDGNLGKSVFEAEALSLAIPKEQSLYLMMQVGVRKMPKLYVFYDIAVHSQRDVVKRSQYKMVRSLKGYSLRGSYGEHYFHSPAYAIRCDDTAIESNILHSDAVSANIIEELNNQKTIIYAKPRRRNSVL